MAKLTEHDKKLLIADYHTNKYMFIEHLTNSEHI